MRAFLTSKAGIGHLVIYGKQALNLSLVYTGILFLAIISFMLYQMVASIEKKLIRNN